MHGHQPYLQAAPLPYIVLAQDVFHVLLAAIVVVITLSLCL